MKKFYCVVGANFGDEGKGLVTDWLAYGKKNCLVVLHNGGAQRGHTVSTADGKRHVFRHMGAGTFAGADTWFAKEFIVNPIAFRMEYEELCRTMIVKPKVYVDPRCKITTAYDMLINQVIEFDRGINKHGSCGYGVYETLRRNQNGIAFKDMDDIKKYYPDAMTFGEFKALGYIDKYNFLKYLRDTYVRRRLDEIGIKKIDPLYENVLSSHDVIKNYIDDFEFMTRIVEVMDEEVINKYDNVIFEGGQGLLLDQKNEAYFPHLTPSNTGLDNPIAIIKDAVAGDAMVYTYYVTRTYMTRHGVGRLDKEVKKEAINPEMVDYTNVPNPFQNTLRYGYIDITELKIRMMEESEKLRQAGFFYQDNLVVTHVNEYVNPRLESLAQFTSNKTTREGVK